MLSIGPYVVVREISTPHPGTPDGTGRTYRATDRLTGIPVLLHHLPDLTGLPQLPAHPALLPFTDLVVHAGEAFLITELPPNAVPARDPMQAARGALMALGALHENGLAHGGMNTAQLWSVDGPVRLAGGGRFELTPEFSVARDLQALATTLEDLGGLPPILSLLRTEPERLSAREALELLQTGEGTPGQKHSGPPSATRGVRFQATDPAALRQAHLPNLDPLSLLNPSAPLPHTPSFVTQAVWTSTQEPSSSNTDAGVPEQPQALPFTLDISQWDLPDFMQADTVVTPLDSADSPDAPTSPASTVSLGWQNVNRPLTQRPAPEVTATPDTTLPPPEESLATRQGRKARAAASQALHRLKSDGQRLRQLQEARRDEAAAQLEHLEGQEQAGAVPQGTLVSGNESLPSSQSAETPQERRRREHQARLEEEQLAERLAEKRGPSAPVPPTPVARADSPTEISSLESDVTADRRQRKSVKMRWDDRTGSWQRVGEGEQVRPTRPTVPWWVWLLAGTIALLLFLGSRAFRSGQAPPAAATPASRCCQVDFRVSGNAGQVGISLLNTTSKTPWKAGQVIGQAPGTLNLPGEGTYKLAVSSEGFTPATLDVTVPTTEPVTINLGQ